VIHLGKNTSMFCRAWSIWLAPNSQRGHW